ncbi:hypothetical protein GJ633_15300 [Halorubrum sp. CBA1125]|uniref:hypothetical protein n=1 Tax=Halorubrum sp. CBA1125 TaxID=2668072 RepID=UPI0012E8B101|nr:hypothetical protein [Halorubrum sp. CBA1125]MUW15824.1 hypothetical protein [Halorubrum sp. CBA1125]
MTGERDDGGRTERGRDEGRRDEDEREGSERGEDEREDPGTGADPFADLADLDGVADPFADLDETVEADDGRSVDSAVTADPVDVAVDADRGDAAVDRTPVDRTEEVDPSSTAANADLDDAFERMDVDEFDGEDVWAALDDASEAPSVPGAPGRAPEDAGGAPTDAETGPADGERVVDKRTYCQQCSYFSEPPDATCTHEGTTIVETVGFDEFRVRNCPMVDGADPDE